MAYEKKYDVLMTEVYKMRMTAEQKASLFSASADITTNGTASEFWREYDVYTAEQLAKLKAGDITKSEFGELMADFVVEYMSMSATVEHPSDKP